MDPDVPLLIPEVNASHLDLLSIQKYGKGKIVTNPNCTTIGLAIALKPLFDHFGIDSLHVATMQAISGAGYPGIPSMEILDNVVPFINGEEDKVQEEPLKILGECKGGQVINANFKVSAQCNRVAVTDGHTEAVSIKFRNKANREEVIEAWKNFSSQSKLLNLVSAPEKTIQYFDEPTYPQPKLHRNLGHGMTVSVGGLRPCPLLDYKFSLLSHNTIRGAAGGAVLIAELMFRKGYIFW
jgi:aspartate-semialdehyde dehydrogenase